jgi:hypothetical protein
MKRFLIAVAVAAVTVISFNTTVFAADVGLSINIGQPDYYGRLDPNGYPPPRVIYRQPKAVNRVQINQPPVYMRVPAKHAKYWSKNCRRYNACDERVLFVQDNWYRRDYAPRYQEQNGNRGNHNNGDRENYNNGNRENNNNGDRGHGR